MIEVPETSVEFTGLSDDDPPIFRLTIAGDSPAAALDQWLCEQPDVQRVHINTVSSVELDPTTIEHLSERHQVHISLEARGTGHITGSADA